MITLQCSSAESTLCCLGNRAPLRPRFGANAAVDHLQAQGDMTKEQEAKLKVQVGELLETTLAVGEHAVV